MKKNPKRISTRLTNKQRETIEQKISAGEYESLSDFLRTSIDLALEISRAAAS
jgi:Arc/MetJ-type ribon-helix-helix transcriptional regulator